MVCDSCALFETEATSFVLGDVPAETRAEMVAHLDTCGTCRREVATLAAALDAISAVTVPMAPSAGFVERVLAAADPGVGTVPQWDPAAPPPEVARRPGRKAPMTLTMPDERVLPVAVVLRRRRTLLGLTGITAALALMAVGFNSGPLLALAITAGVLGVAYLALVMSVTHIKARDDIALAFQARKVTDDSYWRELEPVLRVGPAPDDPHAPPVVAVPNTALAHFVLAYFLGWALTPVVGLIRLVRGDLAEIEQSPVLARIVALQRAGRAQSLKLLVAGATTVAVAGGGTAATVLMAPGMASAATAAPTYTVSPGDTLFAIAARHGVSAAYLAQLNGISDPNFILPGEVIKLGGIPSAAAAAPTALPTASYTVEPGDTLRNLAARFGTTVSELVTLNSIPDPNLILVGQTLRIPAAAGTAGPAVTATTVAAHVYTVRPGDTLAAIAARFGTTVASLAAANHIANPNFVEVGRVLSLVPAAAGTVPAAAPSPAPAPATQHAPAPVAAPVSSHYVNPFTVGSWSPSRIDEGVDWIPNVASPVVAIGDGVITYSSMNSGWPAGAFIVYRLTSGSHAGLYIYVAEHLTGLLPAGTVVRAGQRIATALPGYPWTEWGWASPSGPEPAPSARYNGVANGSATPGGRAFARFLISLGVAGIANPGPGPTTP